MWCTYIYALTAPPSCVPSERRLPLKRARRRTKTESEHARAPPTSARTLVCAHNSARRRSLYKRERCVGVVLSVFGIFVVRALLASGVFTQKKNTSVSVVFLSPSVSFILQTCVFFLRVFCSCASCGRCAIFVPQSAFTLERLYIHIPNCSE